MNYLIEEERRRNVGTTFTQTAAFAVTNKRGKKKRSTWPTCTYYKIRGHMEKDCFKKYPYKRPKGINNSLNNVKANTALTEEIEEKAAVFSTYSVGDHTRRNIYDWYLDSRAIDHFAVNKDNFTIYKILNPLRKVIVDNRNAVSGIGIGTIYLNLLIKDKIKELILEDVIHTPDMDCNLLSAGVIIDKGFEIRMKENSTIILKEDKIIATTEREGRLFQLNLDYTKSYAQITRGISTQEDLTLWYYQLGHLGVNNIKLLADRIGIGINIPKASILEEVCEHCLYGGQHKLPSTNTTSRASNILELIHTDICGPMNHLSLGGAKYFIIFIDDKTRMTFIYLLKTKGKAFDKFKNFQALVENQQNKKIKRIRSNNGGEFTSKKFKQHLQDCGIQHKATVPYTLQQNRVSKRSNRTIIERAKSMLHASRLGYEFWGEVVTTIVYLKNRSPTTAIIDKTPYEAWFGKKPSLNHLRTFGCIVYTYILKEKRHKLDWKTTKYIFLGYSGTNQYRLWDPEKKDIIIAKDIKFDESRIINNLNLETLETNNELNNEELVTINTNDKVNLQQPNLTTTTPTSTSTTTPITTTLRKSQRISKPPIRFAEESYANIAMTIYKEPQTLQEAINHPTHGKQWEEAIQYEYKSLIDNQTWKLVPLPEGRLIVGCKWIFRYKLGADGTIQRFRARLVAKGFT